jgi:hypothetical protein
LQARSHASFLRTRPAERSWAISEPTQHGLPDRHSDRGQLDFMGYLGIQVLVPS